MFYRSIFNSFLFLSLTALSLHGNAILGHVSLVDYIKGHCAENKQTGPSKASITRPQKGMSSHTEMQLQRGLSALHQVNLAQVEQEWSTLKETLKHYKIHEFDHEVADIEKHLPDLLQAIDQLKNAAFAHETEIVTHSRIHRSLLTLQKNLYIPIFLAATQAALFQNCEDQNVKLAKQSGQDPRSSIENCSYLKKLYPELYVLSSIVQSLGEDVSKPCGL